MITSKLRQITVKTSRKNYTYLAIILSKKMMSILNPTSVTVNTSPLLTLQIKKRADGKGYALIPNDLVSHFNFTKGQEVEVTLKTKEEL